MEDEKDPYLAVSEKRFSSYYKDVFARELRGGCAERSSRISLS